VTDHPFVEIESLLARPAATGLFLTTVRSGSPLEEAEIRPGSIVTHVGDAAVESLRGWLEAMQPQGEDDDRRSVVVRGPDGEERTIELPVPLKGYAYCMVEEGKPGWENRPDTAYEPCFDGLEDGTGIWLRNSLGDERAGYERLLVKRTGAGLELDALFRLGGETPDGPWDYRTRALTTHRMDRFLSVCRTAFWEGGPGDEHLHGDVVLGDDGVWRGTHGAAAGGPKEVEVPGTPAMITPYSLMVLPVTMPLEAGSCVTVCVAGEGTGLVTSRSRLERDGPRTVSVDGEDTEAWQFRWVHYGESGEEERFYVSADRRLVRVDWGENYGNCVGEMVDEARVLEGVPGHVTLDW
jgi:hypothetical protein